MRGSYLLLLIPLLIVVADAFLAPSSSFSSSLPGTRLDAVASTKKLKPPTFHKITQKWERASGDDGVYPYDAFGALLRHGPSSFLSRISNPSEYEQGILKYMAATGVSRAEATGNMDAKLGNAADWAFQKLAEKNGAPKVDYTKLDQKNTILRVVWALFITPLVISVILQTVSQFEGPHPPVPL